MPSYGRRPCPWRRWPRSRTAPASPKETFSTGIPRIGSSTAPVPPPLKKILIFKMKFVHHYSLLRLSCGASITTTIMFPFCMQVCGNQDLALLPLLLKGGGEAEQVCRSNIEKKSLKLTNLSKQTIGCKPGGSLPRLHLTLTTTNWTRFAAFSRGEHWTHWTRMV